MRRITILLVLIASAVVVSTAQTPAKISVKAAGFGRLAITSGRLRSVIDVGKDVNGCLYASPEIKRRVKDCAASPAEFKLVDATSKGGFTYALISTEAAGNCNVCGRCGATTAFGLIWLKLDKTLKLAGKQSTPLDFCLLEYTLLTDAIDFDEETQIETLKLKFDDAGRLALDFEQQITTEKESDPPYAFSHLEYSRKNPENGLVIKKEMRMKSSAREN